MIAHFSLCCSSHDPKRIIGHNSKIHEKWVALEEEFFSHSTLGKELLEQVRRVSAWGQECEY